MSWFSTLLTKIGLRKKSTPLPPPPKPEFGLYEYEGDAIAMGFVEEYIKGEGGRTTGIIVSGDRTFVQKVSGLEGDVIVRVFVPAHAPTHRPDQVTHFQAHIKGYKSIARGGKLMVEIHAPTSSNEPTDVPVEEDDEKGSFM